MALCLEPEAADDRGLASDFSAALSTEEVPC